METHPVEEPKITRNVSMLSGTHYPSQRHELLMREINNKKVKN